MNKEARHEQKTDTEMNIENIETARSKATDLEKQEDKQDLRNEIVEASVEANARRLDTLMKRTNTVLSELILVMVLNVLGVFLIAYLSPQAVFVYYAAMVLLLTAVLIHSRMIFRKNRKK